MTKKTQQKTFAVAHGGGQAVLIEMQPNGIDFKTASADDARMALRLGVLCLNSGLSERKILDISEEGATP